MSFYSNFFIDILIKKKWQICKFNIYISRVENIKICNDLKNSKKLN